MGKNIGMVRYIIFAPFARPMNFFKYGGGFVAIWSAFVVINQNQATVDTFISAYIEYITTKYLPPTSLSDLILPIVVGAVLAGLKWRVGVS